MALGGRLDMRGGERRGDEPREELGDGDLEEMLPLESLSKLSRPDESRRCLRKRRSAASGERGRRALRSEL